MFKRIALFVLTNLLIMMTVGAVLVALQAFFGVNVSPSGGVGGTVVWAGIIGFGGAFVSLLLSKHIALWTTHARVIDTPSDARERWLKNTVARLAARAGLPMPTVAVYAAAEPNAFATGPSRRHALVAVSTGLLDAMSEDEVEAVLGHELTHVANGDMVTMTLLQGTLNTFVLVAARVVGEFVDRAIFQNRDGRGAGFFLVSWACQLVFGILASLVVCAFSRYREFRADEGGASLASRAKMVAALRRLGRMSGESDLPAAVHAFGIRGNGTRMLDWFRTHPPIAERIAALEAR